MIVRSSVLLLTLLHVIQHTVGHGYAMHAASAEPNHKQGALPRDARTLWSESAVPFPLEALHRRLEEAILNVTEFCSNHLESIESFATERFHETYPTNITLLTEAETYVCHCQMLEDDYLDLECRTFFAEDIIPIASVEYMRLKLGDNGTSYTPESAGRCKYLEATLDGLTYCDHYVLNSTDPTRLAECIITFNDDTCEGNTECEICEGGQTVNITPPVGCNNPTLSTTCMDGYYGSFLYEYHILVTPIEVMADNAPPDCVDDAPSIDTFCSDLSEIETNLTQAYQDALPELNVTVPFECDCLFENKTLASVSLSCEAFYVDSLNRTFKSTETMRFNDQRKGYLVPSEMEWCDVNATDLTDVYCESFDFAFLQENFARCEIGACEPAACELCSDGLSIAHTCFTNLTCSQGVQGAFLFAYKDTRLAVEECEPTESPTTAMPSDIPSMIPSTTAPAFPTAAPIQKTLSPTLAATSSPTSASSIASTRWSWLLVVVTSMRLGVTRT